ncbi:MAG: putative 4-hydroxybenzoate polyprenyltransferase [Phycisphaeraceae bacterium]
MNSALPVKPIGEKLAIVARDIKLSHTVFAMPFALLATFLAAHHKDRLPSVGEFGLIVLCMFLARTVAMTTNRLADAEYDASNPRTAKRAIPSGELDKRFVRWVAVICALGFILACGGFWLIQKNIWPIILSPIVLAFLIGYSYTKRFTWLCHLYLGIALALSPVAASIAIEPTFLSTFIPWLLSIMVACWVAGFDVIYALQDVQHDRGLGLYSMPATLGEEKSLWISRGLHVISGVSLFALVAISPVLGWLFLGAVCMTIGLLVVEHILVWRSGTHHIHIAFLTLNGMISLLLGAAGIAEVLLAFYT